MMKFLIQLLALAALIIGLLTLALMLAHPLVVVGSMALTALLMYIAKALKKENV
jgi:hypothetical protein